MSRTRHFPQVHVPDKPPCSLTTSLQRRRGADSLTMFLYSCLRTQHRIHRSGGAKTLVEMNLIPPSTVSDGQLPTVRFKSAPEDFVVDENLGFEPSGAGEHIWIRIRKTGCNTRDLVDRFADITGVATRDIGYSGLKDKNAVTSQWFSIRQPLQAALSDEISQIEGVELLRAERSDRKLRTGSHQSNRFELTLRELKGDRQTLLSQIEKIQRRGFPNYFGQQRFGHDGRNLIAARSMFQSKRKKVTRFKRGIYLSAARSWLFNRVLAERVQNDSWLRILKGDVCMLDGTRSIFQVGTETDLQKRHDESDIHLTGPLAGVGESKASGDVLELEQQCLQQESILLNGLVDAGLKQERRALRALAENLKFEWIDEQTLRLSFSLARGVFATALLNELVEVVEK